jgi:hypothetical protein
MDRGAGESGCSLSEWYLVIESFANDSQGSLADPRAPRVALTFGGSAEKQQPLKDGCGDCHKHCSLTYWKVLVIVPGTAPFLFLLETRNLLVEKFEGGDRQLLLASSRKIGQPGPQLGIQMKLDDRRGGSRTLSTSDPIQSCGYCQDTKPVAGEEKPYGAKPDWTSEAPQKETDQWNESWYHSQSNRLPAPSGYPF